MQTLIACTILYHPKMFTLHIIAASLATIQAVPYSNVQGLVLDIHSSLTCTILNCSHFTAAASIIRNHSCCTILKCTVFRPWYSWQFNLYHPQLFTLYGSCIIRNHSGCTILNCTVSTLQMKGRRESNINVWFRFMYSQKWNCLASLFPKQNYNVLSSNFHIHVSLSDLYIHRIGPPILLQPNRQTNPENIWIAHRYMSVGYWERGCAVSSLRIHKSDFRTV